MWPATSTGSIAACGCAPWPPRAVDRDLDAVGGGHRRARRDADACPGGSAGPVVQREHLLGGKALEEAVLDHRLRTGVALLARLEDQVRGAVEVARLVRGSARPRAASSCGRRGRSRACGRRSATCARTRSPPASAARPCRRAGRPRGRSRRRGPGSPRRCPSCRCPRGARCRAPPAARTTTLRGPMLLEAELRDACADRGGTPVNSACQPRMCSDGIHVRHGRSFEMLNGPRRARCAAADRPHSTGGRR